MQHISSILKIVWVRIKHECGVCYGNCVSKNEPDCKNWNKKMGVEKTRLILFLKENGFFGGSEKGKKNRKNDTAKCSTYRLF